MVRPAVAVSGGVVSGGVVSGLTAASMLAMLPVLGLGLWRSGMLGQALWSHTLGVQAGVLLAVAGVVTWIALCRVPVRVRGWPALAFAGVAFATVACGVGPALAVGVVALVCLVLGHAVLLGTGVVLPSAILVAVCGLAALLLVLVGVTLAHLPFGLVAVAVAIVIAAAAGLATWRALRGRVGDSLVAAGPVEPWTRLRAGVAWLILATWFFYAGNAAMPERFFDPLAMHLMIPSQALAFGHWTPDPLRFALALFPIAVDDLFAFAMALGGEGAPEVLNLVAMAGICLILHEIVRGFAGVLVAEVTVLLVLSLPIALLCATTAMVETVLALLMLGAVGAVLRLGTDRGGALVALALLLPAMAATKLHGVVAAVPCVLLAAPALRRLPGRLALRLVAVAVPAALLGVAQYASAWVRTGNPIYPLMNDRFRSPFWPPVAFEDLRWQGHLSWRLLYRMTFDSRTYLESDNGAMGVALLLLLAPGVVATVLAPRRAPVVALSVGLFYAVVIAVKFQYIRYLWPAFPLLLVGCGHAIAVLRPRLVAIGLGSAGLAVALGLFLLPSSGWVLKVADLRAAWSPAARHAMLAAQAPTRLAIEAINAMGPGKPRVLLGSEPYGAFLRGTPIYVAWYNRPLNAALYAAAGPEAVAAVLQAETLDYIVVAAASADPVEQKVLAFAQAHAARIPLDAATTLWRVR